MSITVYLANQNIQVAVGNSSRKALNVQHIYEIEAPKGSLINGVVTEEDTFVQALTQFWKKNHLPRKGVKLVIKSSQLVTKMMEVPIDKHKKTIEYIRREFQNIERTVEPVYSYTILSEDKTRHIRKIIAVMSERQFIDAYLHIMARVGILPEAIESASVCAIKTGTKLLDKESNTIIQILDGMMLESFLFINGEYYYSSSNRIFTTPLSTDYAIEIARSTSRMVQFMTSEQLPVEGLNVELIGLTKATYDMCLTSIEQSNPMVNVTEYDKRIANVRFSSAQDEVIHLHHGIYSISGLWKEATLNLLSDYHKPPVRSKEGLEKWAMLLPTCITAAVCIVVAAVLGGITLYHNQQLKQLEEYNARRDVHEAVKAYDAIDKQLEAINEQSGTITELQEAIHSYPRMNSKVVQLITSCGDKIAQVEIESYDSKTGAVSLNAQAKDVASVNTFIDRLRQQTAFEKIDYKGYRYVDTYNAWAIDVTCYLSKTAGR